MCLFCPFSELEEREGAGVSPRPEPKQSKKREEKTEGTALPSDRKDSTLHLEDLDSPMSPVPDSQSSVDE